MFYLAPNVLDYVQQGFGDWWSRVRVDKTNRAPQQNEPCIVDYSWTIEQGAEYELTGFYGIT